MLPGHIQEWVDDVQSNLQSLWAAAFCPKMANLFWGVQWIEWFPPKQVLAHGTCVCDFICFLQI